MMEGVEWQQNEEDEVEGRATTNTKAGKRTEGEKEEFLFLF